MGGPVETEKTVVTGTNIRSIFEEQTLPVIVITREELERSAALNMEQLVQQIAQVSTAGSITGSTLAGQSTYGQSSVSLRGLGAQRTLVLLNGRRIPGFGLLAATGGGIDLNSIPVAALERVEILTDGASSIYGSDAEAGVINFITRRNYRGAEVTVEYGQPSRSGGGAVEKYSAMYGVGSLKDDRFNFWFNWSRRNEEDLRATDREFSKTGNQPPYLISSATPSGRIEGVFIPGRSTDDNRYDPSTNPLGFLTRGYGNPGRDQPGGCESFAMFPITAGSQAPSTGKNCNFDSNPFVGLIPTQRNDTIFSTFTFQLTPNTRLFAEGLWARNVVTEAIQPNPMRIAFMETDNAFAGTGVDPALLIFPGNPNYPSAWLQSHGLAAMDGKPLAITARTFLTGLRTEQDTNTAKQLTLGIRGTLEKDWEWVFSGVYSKSKTDGIVTNGYFSQLGLARVINSTGNTAGAYWNPWATVQNATLDSALKTTLYVGPTATGEYTNKGIDFRASGTVMEMKAGPLGLAFGAAAHKEEYTVEVPDILGLGDIAGLGGATVPAQGDRRTLSAYAEVNIPIIKTLEVNLSGRVDNYDDLKSDKTPVTGKAAFAWKPIQQLLVRGNVGKGFRAPTMGELHTPVTLGTSEQFVDPSFPEDGPVQVNALTGGNPDLKPEKSKQWSLGVAFSPTRTISGHVDYWSIKIDDFIVSPAALPQVIAALGGGQLVRPDEVVFAGNGAADQVNEVLANAATASFAGFDFGAHWGDGFGFGRLYADYNGTYFTKADLTWPSGLTEHNIGTMVGPDGGTYTLPGNGVILRYKHNLQVGWSNNMFGLNLTQNYYTGYRTGNNQVDGAPHYVDAFTTYDLQGQWTPTKNIKIALGVKNLFDKDPNLVIPTANFFQAGYDPSIYDPRARFYYGRVTVSF